ncbi:hypothetical protein HAX54_000069 [Datura stramonium]|uniref:Uncharacterized protein n=1 Tax=Datura stramonium TaxID=4076 RepID=A0ABS8RGT0_DATST|nr:hypothetical protein [Datura stramonium]
MPTHMEVPGKGKEKVGEFKGNISSTSKRRKTRNRKKNHRGINTGECLQDEIMDKANINPHKQAHNKDNKEDLANRNSDQLNININNISFFKEPTDADSTFLKLISGTSLEEDQDIDFNYSKNYSHQSESSVDDEEGYNGDDRDSSKDLDYGEELNSSESSKDYCMQTR